MRESHHRCGKRVKRPCFYSTRGPTGSLLVYTTIGELSSKFDGFLAMRAQFDSDHDVDFYAPTLFPIRDPCATAFGFLLSFVFFRKKKNK